MKEELTRKPKPSPVQAEPLEAAITSSMTNFDILKRLNRLEKEVFGKQILDNSDF
ncbi:cell division initiation protein [Streptococcus pneumoniae]|nr:cell division initiation protein [Streptococcus pneumoniae]